MDNLEKVFAEYIFNELEPDEDIPRNEEECREFLEGAIAELTSLTRKLGAIPVSDFVNLGFLDAIIKDGLENVNWNSVYQELEIIMKGAGWIKTMKELDLTN